MEVWCSKYKPTPSPANCMYIVPFLSLSPYRLVQSQPFLSLCISLVPVLPYSYEKLQVVLPDKSAAMRQIPKVLEQYLSFYSASDQFDADLLHKVTQNPLDPYLLCIINAVKQRRNERHIIQSALEKTVHYIDNLEKLSWMDEL
eukprot:TRINITY_DN2164_c0_g1_i3.p1 TRINITY_DN2164_c0_g1~~TRINITY_DN2164_c0_g1_i3.p1  ORF type:complete len:144 (+),score=23.83 TRINITY_DN2164_c0_g1_i3:583-1014(+)